MQNIEDSRYREMHYKVKDTLESRVCKGFMLGLKAQKVLIGLCFARANHADTPSLSFLKSYFIIHYLLKAW